ncbi:ABC transporter substrate-binding protein [Bifidobacterium saguinibicoloris]|uniref:ABC transporter substrate-binding protein n=1 Tax=Bifidobacterium saguinibicoloris TaxID=2834433 RepID=UPI001C565C53|nr:sugar ABC transporter substrate-binding protein [Bifidobacterium saguinibicoloris]MBW3081161.1 sugar ABC transporter substrate-binding protein [Bifidobacterium saguinibicoloris]
MRSRITRMVAAAVGAMAMIVPMAACGSGSSSASGDTLTVYSYYNKNTMDPVVAAFEKANPDIKVQISYSQGDSDYNSTLQTRIAGNQAPDVFNLNGNNRADLMSNGAAADITDADYLKGIDETYLADYTKDGKIYGMPISGWLAGVVYNKDLLKEVGYDSVPDNLDDFAALAKKLKDKGITPFLENGQEMSGSLIGLLGSYYAKAGEDGDKRIYAGKSTFAKEWTKAFEAWNDGFIKSGALPEEATGLNADQVKQSFINGEAAMYRTGGWDVADIKAAGVNYGFSPFPAYPGSEPYIDGGADPAFAISAKTKKKAQAEKFLSFMNSKEGLKLFTTAYGSASVSSNYDSQIDEQLKPLYDDYFFKGKFHWVSFEKGSTAMSAEVISQQQGIQGGKTTPADAAKNLDSKWDSVK